MTDLAPQELRVLVAVDRERGFTAAADRLGLTQSAVSHTVRGCERKVGAVLFDRGRYGARPTPAGERVVAHARQILRLLESMGAEARAAAGGEPEELSGPLRIAAFRSAAAHLLPAVLERLTARHPRLTPQVRIVREIGRGTAGEVADGHADLGIATLSPGTEPAAGLLVGELFEETYALAHPVGHPDPRGLPLIDWDENCGSYTRRWWSEQDWLPKATITAEDDSVVLSMVAQGMGMAIVPELTLAGAPSGIAVASLAPRPPTRGVGYVTTPALARTREVRELIRELRAARSDRSVPAQAGADAAVAAPTGP
ncbi:LysR family transcriptional regulator [Streptomyces sp. P1-3]|uniref:LysR family transcriptional regulator n=1 Tax=Streptomyces sp. P1-3 TaxID=3421658 RepID=UPI003D36357C